MIQGSLKRSALLIILPALLLSACGTVRVANYSNPGEFARNLFRIAEDGNVDEWGTQLTPERQAMGKPYVMRHFEVWRKSLQELKQSFGVPVEKVNFRLDDTALEFEVDNKWYLLLRVTHEGDALRINQD